MCTRLKALILWREGHEKSAVDEEFESPANDERIVAMRTVWENDWEQEAKGTGLGMWMLADKILEERRTTLRKVHMIQL